MRAVSCRRDTMDEVGGRLLLLVVLGLILMAGVAALSVSLVRGPAPTLVAVPAASRSPNGSACYAN